jgi:hypothetical protein
MILPDLFEPTPLLLSVPLNRGMKLLSSYRPFLNISEVTSGFTFSESAGKNTLSTKSHRIIPVAFFESVWPL